MFHHNQFTDKILLWQVKGTASERRQKSAEVGGAAKWRDVDQLSTSIRLNILQDENTIYRELPDRKSQVYLRSTDQ